MDKETKEYIAEDFAIKEAEAEYSELGILQGAFDLLTKLRQKYFTNKKSDGK